MSNVAAGIEIEVKPAPKMREREFTAEEARKVLSATLRPPLKPMTVENAAVRRWVPWLLAYSGARLNEITQLRYQDIHSVENPDDRDHPIWPMKITPEAGTVKTSFYDPKRARKRSDENPYFRPTAR